jgi:hypothetical protein
MIYELEIPGTPKSKNQLDHAHWNAVRKEKQTWEGHCMVALLHARVPKKLRKVRATAELRFPTSRRRDEGNFRSMLEKALGDALQVGGWLEDDTPEHFTFGELTFAAESGVALTRVTLEVEA